MDALFLAALFAGLSYWPGSELPLAPAMLIVWKGAGVGLLTLWAAVRARGTDGWLLVAVLGCGTAGDVLLETNLEAGAIAFLIGHFVAITLYLRNRREETSWAAVLLVPALVAAAILLPAERSAVPGVALYSLGVAAMAACASMSRFRIAALGAWLFVVSDLLILARMGPLSGSFVPDLLVWPLYFSGQAMIAWDVGGQIGFSRRVAESPR